MTDTATDAAFRAEVRDWLEEQLSGEYADLRGLGGPGREDEAFDERLAWNRHLAKSGWTCLGWPEEYGGRGLTLQQQVIFHEEYARADAPHKVNHFGEELIGPTLIAFGTEAQKQRFLPGMRDVTELWCQGYSEPGAGSDLANVSTRARLDPVGGRAGGAPASPSRDPGSDQVWSVGGRAGGAPASPSRDPGSDHEWVIDGQKVWTSLAQFADWIFVVARTEPGSQRHAGLSFLLVPIDQPGVEVRPIQQLTGDAEFNEVFFTGARTAADLVVGDVGDGWRVAMGLLGFERGVSVLGQQVGFARELDDVVALARRTGAIDDPVLRDRLAQLKVELDVMRANAVRMLASVTGGQGSDAGGGAASIAKLVWANWHQKLGELAMDVAGPDALTASAPPYELDRFQRLFLFSRADTIYGGSDEIQRTILAERVLGLPREPKGTS
jgi:alkylation response protein AidB-like acyl-CoA dehydrogenase